MKLLFYAIKYKGEYKLIHNAVLNNEPYEIVNYDGNYITIDDENYPSSLKQLSNPPYVLFYEGDISLLNQNSVCVVGSREHSQEVVDNIKILCSYNMLFVSGLAKGIDGLVHLYAQNSIGVIGCGVDVVYPKINEYLYKKVKLLISEYPKGVKPLKHHFLMRNRIMVALSKCLIIGEMKRNSGTQTSLNIAQELGKEIFVFPSSFKLEENINNLLIYEGANIIYSIEVIKYILNYLNN